MQTSRGKIGKGGQVMGKIRLTTWCGGSPGNSECDYNCKLCLILTGKTELISHDDKSLKLTYRIKENPND